MSPAMSRAIIVYGAMLIGAIGLTACSDEPRACSTEELAVAASSCGALCLLQCNGLCVESISCEFQLRSGNESPFSCRGRECADPTIVPPGATPTNLPYFDPTDGLQYNRSEQRVGGLEGRWKCELNDDQVCFDCCLTGSNGG